MIDLIKMADQILTAPQQTQINTLKAEVKSVIEQNGYMPSADLVKLVNCDNDDDFYDVLLEVESDYNYATLHNGDGYLIGKSVTALKQFVSGVSISDRDSVWCDSFEADGNYIELREVLDDEG